MNIPMDENVIVTLQRRKIVTETFRRLPPRKKEKIYTVARELLADREFDRVSLDHIAAGAGVSKGSLLQYFVSKENILSFTAAVILQEFESFGKELFRRETAVKTRDRLLSCLTASFGFWMEPPVRFLFLMRYFTPLGGLLPDEILESLTENRRRNIMQIVERGISTGELRPDIPAERMVLLIMGVEQAVREEIAYAFDQIDRTTVKNSIERLLSLLWQGIQGGRG